MGIEKKFTLWALSWPIFIEMFLQFLLGTADTLMVSRVSDDAVAVVGISNQLFSAMIIVIMTIAGGAGVLIAQRFGARKTEDARKIAVMAINFSIIVGTVLSVVLVSGTSWITKLLQLPDELKPLAATYISIVGGGMVLTSLMTSLSTVIRNTGNTRGPMYIAFGMNVVHIVMNYCFIFGALGFPKWGLTGVAISTLTSRTLATVVLLGLFLFAFERRLEWRDIWTFDRKLFKEVLRIGWPMGINMASWMLTQLLIYMFIAMIGAKELAARTYMNSLESFCFMLGYSIAMGVQIQIAHLFGAGRTREAYAAAYRALWIGLSVVTLNALLLFIFGRQVLTLFTSDPQIIEIGITLLVLNLILQPCKMLNMGMGGALTAVGDTRFLMVSALSSMWIIAAGLSYVLGVELKWGVIGIYIAMISDEFLRGVFIVPRWMSRKYLNRADRERERQAQSCGGAMALEA
ncbi:MATE family efflux transporter [Paenibacillus athensensis]|uniref:MATE family efflux transporter n=1 Tax=Paenibacillus athensensis TaxID=1967502 RepID=A0A4Y8PUF9_9BACL|nr:MATE family efflux transporter [Paenibacillus athensensis]MCD1261726.1 MATE family efflux transporter [Paenibacillus athensensis]